MPTHPVHNAHDVLMWGYPFRTFDYVHKALDTPFVILYGKDHRGILHDPETVGAITRQFGPMAGMVAAHHIFMDSPTRYVDSEAMNGNLVWKKKR